MALIHHHEGTKAAKSVGKMTDSGLVNKLALLLAKKMKDRKKNEAKISQFRYEFIS